MERFQFSGIPPDNKDDGEQHRWDERYYTGPTQREYLPRYRPLHDIPYVEPSSHSASITDSMSGMRTPSSSSSLIGMQRPTENVGIYTRTYPRWGDEGYPNPSGFDDTRVEDLATQLSHGFNPLSIDDKAPTSWKVMEHGGSSFFQLPSVQGCQGQLPLSPVHHAGAVQSPPVGLHPGILTGFAGVLTGAESSHGTVASFSQETLSSHSAQSLQTWMQGAPLQQDLMPPLLSSPYPGLFLRRAVRSSSKDTSPSHDVQSLQPWMPAALLQGQDISPSSSHQDRVMSHQGQGTAMQPPTSALRSSKERIVSQLPYSRLSKSKNRSKGKDSRLAANDEDAGKARPSHSVAMEKAIASAMHQHHLSADDALEYVLAMLARFTTVGSNSGWLLCNRQVTVIGAQIHETIESYLTTSQISMGETRDAWAAFIKVLTDARTVMSVAIANFVPTLSADFQMHQISWDAILHDFGYSRDFTQENGRHRNPLVWNQLLRWLYEGSESMAACSPSTLQSNIHNNLIGTYFIIVFHHLRRLGPNRLAISKIPLSGKIYHNELVRLIMDLDALRKSDPTFDAFIRQKAQLGWSTYQS